MTTRTARATTTALVASSALLFGVAAMSASPASATPETKKSSSQQPTPNIDGSRIEVSSGCGNPFPAASSYDDFVAGRVATVEHNRPHISQGYNNHEGPRARTLAKSKKKVVEFQSKIDAAAYLGHGYWIGAHNDYGYGKKIVIAKYPDGGKPSELAKPDAFWTADYEDSGIRDGKTYSVGKLTVKVRYQGNYDGNYNWNVEVQRFTPVSSKIQVTNQTGHLVAVASNHDDFVNRPKLLHGPHDSHWNSGYEDKRAPRTTRSDDGIKRETAFSSNNDATVYLGRGYWLGTVADNGDTIFTVAKFDKTDGDPADGAKPTASESTAMPLYRWEPYGRTIEIGGLKVVVLFHGVSTTEASYTVQIHKIPQQ